MDEAEPTAAAVQHPRGAGTTVAARTQVSQAPPALNGGATSPDEKSDHRPGRRLERLRDSLFPVAPAAPVTRRRVVFVTALLGLGLIYSLGRVRGPGALDTVFAEDGRDFLHDAATLSVFDAVTKSYAGYYHLGPRLLAEITASFPVAWWAAVNAVLVALATLGLALVVYAASGPHLRQPALRLLAAAPVVAQWAAVGEAVEVLACLQFCALYALFWLLLGVPARPAGKVAAPVLVLMIALSSTLSVALVPLALARALLRRDRSGVLMAVLLVTGVGAQLLGLATGHADRGDMQHLRLDPGWLLDRVAQVQVPVAYLGESWIRSPIVHVTEHRGLVLLGWAVVVAALGLALLRRTRPAWTLAAVAALHAFALFALPVTLFGAVPDRYLVTSTLLLVVVGTALLRLVFATLLTVVAVANYRGDLYIRPSGVPSWSGQVAAAKAMCRADPTLDATPLRSGPVRLGWGFTLPCARLR